MPNQIHAGLVALPALSGAKLIHMQIPLAAVASQLLLTSSRWSSHHLKEALLLAPRSELDWRNEGIRFRIEHRDAARFGLLASKGQRAVTKKQAS